MIREAKAKDQQAIQHLYEKLSPRAPVRVLVERIEELRTDPNNFLFVYEEEGCVVGTVFLTFCLSPMFGTQPFGVLEYFVVDEGCRGRGIGGEIIEYACEKGREHHCTVIMLLSNNFRQEAHRLFERHGFDGSLKKGFVRYLNRERL